MRIFGLPIPFTGEQKKALASVPEGRGGWFPLIREPFSGAWQRNVSVNYDSASAFHADFACKTLIARDIAKLRVKLAEKDSNDIWSETTNPAFSPVLRRPNNYQTRNQFWETWVLSKLSRGNAYVLKVRDQRNVVIELHVLDPTRVQPLVSDDGSVFYRLHSDNLANLDADIIVPAREIIHDRFNCLFHPLVGTPPVFASGLASMLGLNAQQASAFLFQNASTPGGILTAPGPIDQANAERLKASWQQGFSGSNIGRIAVMGDGLKYEKVTMTHVEGQLVESLKWSAETVCSVYHVPPYKVGVGALPSYNNVQSLNVEYYSQALQSHIEEIEELLDHALGIGWGVGLGTEFDTDNLLRMDSVTLMDMLEKAKSVMTLDERRKKIDLGHIEGGKTIYLQQQDHSIEAIAARDAMLIEQAKNPMIAATAAVPSSPPQQVEQPEEELDEEKLAALSVRFTWALKDAHREAA